MTQNNFHICTNCGENNPLFTTKCKNCQHYFRANIVNIDLWNTIWKLFESPTEALRNIIYAEHKNFNLFLLSFLTIKLIILSAFYQSYNEFEVIQSKSFIYNILVLFGIYSFFIILFSFLLNLTLKKFGKTRLKDTFSVLVYSFIPLVLSLFISNTN